MLPLIPLVITGISSAAVAAHLAIQNKYARLAALDNKGLTKLQKAIVQQNIKAVRSLIEKGANVDARDGMKTPTLFYAAQNEKILKILIRHEVCQSAVDAHGRNVLFYIDKPSCAELLEDALPDSRDITGKTPLFCVPNAEMAQFLVSHKADCNAEDEDGFTPIFYAKNPQIAQCLIYAGADVYKKNKDGISPLDFIQDEDILCELYAHIARKAIAQNDISKLRETLQTFPKVANSRDNKGNPLLHTAIYSKCPGSIDVVIAAGADVDALDSHGDPLIFSGILISHVHAVKSLCEAGANVNTPDSSNRTTLRAAFFYRQYEILEELVMSGASVFQVDDSGRTPLFFAQKASLIRAMAKVGADFNAENNEGKTALFFASNDDIMHSLVQYGADVNYQDHEGKSALFYATTPKMVKALIKNRADTRIVDKSGQTIFNCPNSRQIVDSISDFIQQAIAHNELDQIRAIIDDKRLIKLPNRISFLFDAIKARNIECLKLLIEAGANVNVVDKEYALIIRAIDIGDPQMIRILLKAGAVVDIHNTRSHYCDNDVYNLFYSNHQLLYFNSKCLWPIFSHALKLGNLDIIAMLVNAGMRIDNIDPLLKSGDATKIERFLDRFPACKRFEDESLLQAFITAVQAGNDNLFSLLLTLSKKYSVLPLKNFELISRECIIRKQGRLLFLLWDKNFIAEHKEVKWPPEFTPDLVHHAIRNDDSNAAEFIMSLPTSDFQLDKNWSKSSEKELKLAIESSSLAVTHLILKKHRELLAHRNPLLFWAAQKNDLQMISLLADEGADLNCEIEEIRLGGNKLHRLMEWAAAISTPEVFQALIDIDIRRKALFSDKYLQHLRKLATRQPIAEILEASYANLCAGDVPDGEFGKPIYHTAIGG